VADVPVGVFLSGGLDSSTVAFFAQQSTEHQIKTFSIGFKDASFDESIYAREVATLLGTDHQEHIVGPDDLRNVIQTLPQVLDEPMADSSIIPTLLLSAFTRKEVKVALGGDGADELFWGYDTFFAHRLASWYEKIPKAAHVGIRALVSELPVSHRYMSFDFKAKKFLSGFDTEKSRRNTYWLSAFMPHELSSILNFEVDESIILASSDAYYGEDTHFYDSLQMEYMRGYLAEDILVKTDRAGMAFGLEVRAPFLDIDLVNFAMTLNQKYKIHNSSGKYILKQIMKGYLPDHIIERKKKGFNIPVGAWIQEELRDFFTETILNGPLSTSGLFKREGLAILLESHISGEHDHRKKLWSLLVLALWMKEWHE
jgi:asparagine synthase (glutamine-hydrolysing)